MDKDVTHLELKTFYFCEKEITLKCIVNFCVVGKGWSKMTVTEYFIIKQLKEETRIQRGLLKSVH